MTLRDEIEAVVHGKIARFDEHVVEVEYPAETPVNVARDAAAHDAILIRGIVGRRAACETPGVVRRGTSFFLVQHWKGEQLVALVTAMQPLSIRTDENIAGGQVIQRIAPQTE